MLGLAEQLAGGVRGKKEGTLPRINAVIAPSAAQCPGSEQEEEVQRWAEMRPGKMRQM